MRRGSDSQSAIVSNAGLPINLRTRRQNVVSLAQTAITNRRDDCMTKAKEALLAVLDAAKALIDVVSKERREDIRSEEHAGERDQNEQEITRPAASGCNPIPVSNPQIEPKARWYESHGWWNVVANGVLAFFAFLAFCMARNQWQEAAKQADAAQKQLAQMERQNRLDERAWVFPYTVEGRRKGSNLIHFLVHTKNAGRTPAVKAVASTGCLWPTNNMTPRDVASEIERDEIKPTPCPSVLYPGQDVIFNQTIPDPRTDIYIVGTIIYDDIFGNRHTNQFCYILPFGQEGVFEAPFHNSIDDEQANKQ
jgi:hypothetical protein